MNKIFTRLIFSISFFLGVLSFTTTKAQCHAAFSYNQAPASLNVDFIDSSISPGGVVTSWLWTFGDGTSSTLQNPQHTFTHDGTFHVCLTIHDNQGCSSDVCHDIIVTGIPPACHAVFTSVQISNTLTVEFADASTSSNTINSWHWDFGDGTTSTDQNPHHTFTHDGTFHVCLITHDDQGCVSDVCHDITVNPVPSNCHTSFTFGQVANTLTVEFTDASTTPAPAAITSWQWNFGDGTTSTDQNPHHTFPHDGTFHVCLITHDNLGCVSDFCHDVVVAPVTVPVSCHALFTVGQTNNPLEIHFTDASTSANTITSWLWEFGDGTSSHDQNISHTYTHDGTYHVCLTIHDNQGCTNTYCHDIQIGANPAICHAEYSFNIDSTGIVHFTNTSNGTTPNTTYTWNFGDGTSSIDENPHHHYDHPDHYTVCLFIHDSTTGCESHYCHTLEYNQRNSHALVSQYYFVNNDGSAITLNGEQYIISYPNPFITSATIQYELTQAARVQIDIVDANGRRMAKVLDQEQSAGQHTQTINAGSLNTGLYIIKMNVGGENFQKKIMIVK